MGMAAGMHGAFAGTANQSIRSEPVRGIGGEEPHEPAIEPGKDYLGSTLGIGGDIREEMERGGTPPDNPRRRLKPVRRVQTPNGEHPDDIVP